MTATSATNGTPRPISTFEDWQIAMPQPDQQAEAARAEAEALLAQANRTHAQASQDADRVRAQARHELAAARAEAQQIRDQAQAAINRKADKKKGRDSLIDGWSPRVALAATIGLTASGEFALAQLAGWAPSIAWLLPLAIDVYVVQSFRRHRDVAAALTLMVVANAIYHLAAAGLFGVDRSHGESTPTWWLIVGVAAIAPLVMWRIHRITAPPRESKQRRESGPGESGGRERETGAAALSESAVEGRAETPALPSDESSPDSHESVQDGLGESAVEDSDESTLTDDVPQPKQRESKAKVKPKRRESKPRESARRPVSPIGDIEREISQLLALMAERGGAEAVSLKDAERITGKASATAARRLSAARDRYRKTA